MHVVELWVRSARYWKFAVGGAGVTRTTAIVSTGGVRKHRLKCQAPQLQAWAWGQRTFMWKSIGCEKLCLGCLWRPQCGGVHTRGLHEIDNMRRQMWGIATTGVHGKVTSEVLFEKKCDRIV